MNKCSFTSAWHKASFPSNNSANVLYGDICLYYNSATNITTPLGFNAKLKKKMFSETKVGQTCAFLTYKVNNEN